MAADVPETFVYVSNAGTKDIHAFGMNRNTGELSAIDKTPLPGTDETSLASLPMALAPSKRFIYAQLRGKPYPVSTLSIDHKTGKLLLVDTVPLVDQMAYLNVDRAGKHLLGASYAGAKVAVYPINALYAVEEKPTQVVDTKPKAHCVFLDVSGKHVYVPVLGADHIMQFTYDSAAGKLTPNDPPTISTKPGSGPRHFTIHPNGKWGYLTCETSGMVGAFAIDKDKGTLSEIGYVETGDYKSFKDGNAAASDLHVTPNGKFVYAAVRSTSMLHGFQIDADKGTLSPIGKWPTETEPRGFNIDPRGKFLIAAGMKSASLTVYGIDDASGALKSVKQHPVGMQPNWIEIVDRIVE